MEIGGQYKGSRTYRVASTRRGVLTFTKKRKRLFDSDSSVVFQEAYDYFRRVRADGGTVDLASEWCVNEALRKLV